MIVTVTLNPAIDQIYRVCRLPAPHEALLVRARQTLRAPGGKGINISLMLHRLGCATMAMGLVAGPSGQLLERLLHEAGITTNFVWTEGETRTNVTIVEDGREAHPLEVNAAGPHVAPAARDRFLRRYRNALKRAACFVLAGSLPPGLEPGFYRTLIQEADSQGVRVVLNVGGKAQEQAASLGPWLHKPDIRETPQVLGRPIRSLEEALAAGQALLETGTEIAVIGHDLARPVASQLVVTRQGAWDYRTGEIRVRNRLGAGDAFIGAMLWRLHKGDTPRQAGRYGMAAAIAAAEAAEPIPSGRRQLERALERVEEVVL